MPHFMLDIETTGKTTDACILSVAITYFDLTEDVTYKELIDRTCFIKFDVAEQKKMGRKLQKDTLEWWKNQNDVAKKASLIPSKYDVSVEKGLQKLNQYVAKYQDKNSMCWARGTLDQLLLDFLYIDNNMKPAIHYNKYMCVRTFMRLMKESTNNIGYATIPNFDKTQVIKHHPVHDNCYDIFQILYGE